MLHDLHTEVLHIPSISFSSSNCGAGKEKERPCLGSDEGVNGKVKNSKKFCAEGAVFTGHQKAVYETNFT